ncbi:hypothetical protein [Falsiroseomonas sp. E2-1-a20]|uniref:hypothetical protein n=1 Tax=Falsiroseomonas sp. E2-1-a20 TaxID=3239300 RepID=UPI003F30B740
MGTIRRAAVTGLFAAWLAPLTASADNPSTGRNAGGDLWAERPADPDGDAVAERGRPTDLRETAPGPTAET